MLLIGLGGHMGSGKDTVGDYLRDVHGFHKLSFAEPLKAAVMAVFGLTREQVYDQKLKEVVDPRWSMTPRQLLQKFGQAMRDLFGEDVWVRSLLARMDKLQQVGADRFVITDTRHPNEMEMVRQHGGETWLIQRPGYEDHTGHVSELLARQPTKWDRVLANDGDLDDLFDRVHTILTGGAR